MCLIRRLFVFFHMFLLSATFLSGQSSIRFENYSIEDGLPSNRVACVNQDASGWIWVGMIQGLSRFDGYSFKTYQLFNPGTEEGSSGVRCIYTDSESRLWIGTEDAGLVLYNNEMDDFSYYTFNDTSTNCISSNLIYSITSDSSGMLWIGTDNGLNCFDPKTEAFQRIQYSDSVPATISQKHIQKVFVDKQNRLWIGSDAGLNLYNPETGLITQYDLNIGSQFPERTSDIIMDISEDGRGNILVGTYNTGLFIIDLDTKETSNIIPDPDYRRSYTIRALYEDDAGNIWLGTRGGIYILDQSRNIIDHYIPKENDNNSLSHISVQDIFEDRTGDVWISTRAGFSHVNKNRQAFSYYQSESNNERYLNNAEIFAILEDRKGDIWLGTESGGINILNKRTGQFSYLTHEEDDENTICSNCIKSIIQDQRGNFWIGSFLGGLDYYDVGQNRYTHFKNEPNNENSLANNTVWALLEDRKGNIWIGTDNGIDRYDPITKRFSHNDVNLEGLSVYAIYEDRSGNLYFGTSEDRLIIQTRELNILQYDIHARVFLEDSKGRIWIGADSFKGLHLFDIHDGVIKTYTTNDGLPSNQIYGILEDDGSNLWLSTGLGLSVFNVDSMSFKNYRAEDGIQGNNFYYGAYLKSKTGELYFGGQKGLTSFYPENLMENHNAPPVIITNLKIFNKDVPIGIEFQGKTILEKSISELEGIEVNYDHSVLTFEYTALNYINSSQNAYAYILEGFEEEWNYVNAARSATYTNLDPGRYTFRVKASNNDGVWNETGVFLDITVSPPFWKTALFKILLVLLLGFIVFLIVIFFAKRERLKNQLVLERIKSKELHKIDMMKFQFFTNISHEIRTPISLILSPLTRIINSDLPKHQIKQDLDVVYRNATRLGKLIDQLLDFRKIEAGKLKLELSKGDLVSYLKKVIYLFKELSSDKKVNLEFYSVIEQIQMYFDADKIEKVLFNLLSNSFKHTPEGGTIRVAVSLTYEMDQDQSPEERIARGEYVQIVVKDTGHGIPESKRERIFERFYQGKSTEDNINTGSGIGLSLSRELVRIHNGFITLKSQEGVGTELTILLPLIKEDPEKKVSVEIQDMKLSSIDGGDDEEIEFKDSQPDNGNPILLILEDNRELLEFIKSIFAEDYNLLFAEDGETGLQIANEHIPDIIISDILMPKMDGKKVCKAIKQDFKTSHIPVILLTALSSKNHEKEGILAGADEYIEKPFDPSLLKVRVDQLLATRRLLREKYNRENILHPVEKSVISPDDKFLNKLVCIIEENISDPTFGTVKISREIGVSRTQLYRKMAALTEMTVKEFIRSIRLKRACQSILQGEMNISEVAYSVGFQQVAYFRKCFKEVYKMTPSDYIRKNSKLKPDNGGS